MRILVQTNAKLYTTNARAIMLHWVSTRVIMVPVENLFSFSYH